MIDIVIRRDIGGTEVTFATAQVDPGDVNSMADSLTAAADRQYAKMLLRETLVDFLAAQKSLDMHAETVREYQRQRALERAQAIAAFMASYPETKRSPYVPSRAQREQMRGFDADTEAKLKEYDDAKTRLRAALPDLENKIARLRKRIDGADMIDLLEDERQGMLAPVAVAAE